MESEEQGLKKEKIASIIQDEILTGIFLPGQQLPPERDFAERFDVSRPVVHEALLGLQAKGLITIRPRHGCIVNDFTSFISMGLLTELYRNKQISEPEKIETGLVEFRQLILIYIIKKLIKRVLKLSLKERHHFFLPLNNKILFSLPEDIETSAIEDFEFYRTLIELSDSPIFLLTFETAKEIYKHQFKQFLCEDLSYADKIPEYKQLFFNALVEADEERALRIMAQLTRPETYRDGAYHK
ncbi:MULTISPECIES: FadR/GntR family transcriptional regulator [unclassified Treponema]|uniref:FadR/GntR family transcriptional regulator n=1 Tax=unclassified Treponema TaxID=2638727 RepID=UPI0020A4222E|nr:MULTISPECIES: GntR family transcriptional regulator [unclassified Treponema]UTC66848.1 FadR family transcriptional regulator [Treponema sp. OMZ 789]UTC69577.1 FadR family transcriptional regulator [Treponema sp. OMZ 790]UTC72291.1 FadR family transcriptional regulator [Treponema sp. OMZ 791]